MKAIPVADITFNSRVEVDFQKNKILLVAVNAASFILFVIFYLLFYYSAFYAGIIRSDDIFYFFKSAGYLPLTGSIIFLLALVFILLLHELIHGFFFYLFTGAKPVIGFKSVYAYAGAPDWYIKKKYFQVITLAPLIIISVTGFILLFFINPPYSSILFLLITANAAGSAGDIWMSILLMRKPPETYINDSGIASFICN
jgi:hypothetical protein